MKCRFSSHLFQNEGSKARPLNVLCYCTFHSEILQPVSMCSNSWSIKTSVLSEYSSVELCCSVKVPSWFKRLSWHNGFERVCTDCDYDVSQSRTSGELLKWNPVFIADSLYVYTPLTALQLHRNGSDTRKLKDEDDGKGVVQVHSKWNPMCKCSSYILYSYYSI